MVVCGPSGSGKSTLIRTINKLEPIQKGSLFVDGIDLSDKKADINKLRAEIGMVFQQFNLYPHLSALSNIVLAPIKIRKMSKKDAEDQAVALLERVGLVDKKDSYPDTALGRSTAESRHCPGSCHETEDYALRRTHLGS